MNRTARVERTTSETTLTVEVDLDGTGKGDIATGVGFYDHMLTSLSKHSGIDLTVRADGDLHIDAHHTVEDVAIALGQAFAEALGDKRGITRYGDATIPMDEVLVQAAVDLSGRPYFVHAEPADMTPMIGPDYPTSLTRHVLESFAFHARIALHVRVLYAGRDAHHIVECQFKALARALRAAVALDPRITGIPSTKGALQVGFASGLIVIGCFLLGGAWSIFRANDEVKGRTGGQWFFVGVLLVAAALAITSGVLRY